MDEDFGEDFIVFLRGDKDDYGHLCQYAQRHFSSGLGLRPSVTVDFVSKLDYEMHQILENRDEFNQKDKSYDTFDRSMRAVSSNISAPAREVCLSMCEKRTLSTTRH